MENNKLLEIITALEHIERNNLSDDPQIRAWIKNITNANFRLVESLIDVINDNLSDSKLVSDVLKVLRKFIIYEKSTVIPQIVNNSNFRDALINYLIKTNNEKLSGDAFFLLSDIFSEDLFKNLINENFINALFRGLDVINSEDSFNSIVKMMTQINTILNSQGNIFLKVYSVHHNSNIFSEILLRLIANESDNKQVMYDVIECLIGIMEYTQSSFLYQNDLESLVNLSIGILTETYTEELRIYILTLLIQITKYDDYYKNSYKNNELIDILEDYKDSDKVSKMANELSQQIIFNINNH